MKKYYLIANCEDCNKLISTYAKRCVQCYFLDKTYKSYIKTIKLLYKLNSHSISWFVGFWEGEGCLQIDIKCNKSKLNPKKKYYGFQLFVAQKETKMLYKIKKEFGIGEIYGLGNNNVCSIWSVNNIGEILAFLKYMTPYMRSNRRLKQVNKVLKHKSLKNTCLYIKERL